ncbi:MAG: CAP family protein [Verrucomicrobiales bacterium]|nr:CAP family protein [Verrucomicrobiales bacterium]
MNRFTRALALLLAALFALTGLPQRLGAQGNKGGDVKNLVITFTNTTDRKVIVNSSAPGQPLQAFGEIQVGQSVPMKAYPGQRWVFVNTNGKVFGEYVTRTEPRQQAFSIAQTAGGAGNSVKPVPAPGNPNAVAITAVAGNTGSRLTQQQAQQMVNYHNQKRAEVGNGNVSWSTEIAQYAQQRAEQIARTKQLAHLPQGQNPYGENLASGDSAGGGVVFTVINACDGWYSEKAKMPRNARTMTIDLFNKGVGHYTQMVWKGSTQIGAGISQYQQGAFTMTVVVCCYNPPGNVINQAIY